MSKMYAFIDEGRVREIIKSEGVFENIPLERRYPKEIVDKCVEIDESVKEGMDYNWETGEFTEHVDDETVVDNNFIDVNTEEEENDGSGEGENE